MKQTFISYLFGLQNAGDKFFKNVLGQNLPNNIWAKPLDFRARNGEKYSGKSP